VVNLAETFGVETDSNRFMRNDSKARLPSKATTGSAAYDVFPLDDITIPPHTRQTIPTGLSYDMPSNIYAQLMPQSGISSKQLLDVIPRVLDSDYRGDIKVLLHNHSDKPVTLKPDQAMAQILFLPLSNLPKGIC
jgi:dUTP pyrophosphatase